MNVFLPYENDIVASVRSLDDVRLQKQAIETYQLLTLAIKERKEGHEVKAGHYHHPVYLFYKDNAQFLAYYFNTCYSEYYYRFNKFIKIDHKFDELLSIDEFEYETDCGFITLKLPQYTPCYMEGSKGQPNYIRTTDNVSALFQQKLINKWNNDKAKGRPPRWTNRDVPEFYKKVLKERNGK